MKKSDGLQIIEYIRSSIEIIMNLKVEDLEKEIHAQKSRRGLRRDASQTHVGAAPHDEDLDSLNSSSMSINPQSFVLASMKEALAAASSFRQHGSINLGSKSTAGGGGGLIQEINDALGRRTQQQATGTDY